VSGFDPESLSPETLIQAYEATGYRLFRGELNLNIFGIRTGLSAGSWDDWIGLLYERHGAWQLQLYRGTTDPSDEWLIKGNDSRGGTAILKAGQYRSCWQLGTHKGYRALQQTGPKPMTVIRDGDKDSELDFDGAEDTGWFGINLHRGSAHRAVPEIGLYSAGCQVIQDPTQFEELMDTVASSCELYGKTVSYTLFNASEVTA
jgi:hypothetical protein